MHNSLLLNRVTPYREKIYMTLSAYIEARHLCPGHPTEITCPQSPRCLPRAGGRSEPWTIRRPCCLPKSSPHPCTSNGSQPTTLPWGPVLGVARWLQPHQTLHLRSRQCGNSSLLPIPWL